MHPEEFFSCCILLPFIVVDSMSTGFDSDDFRAFALDREHSGRVRSQRRHRLLGVARNACYVVRSPQDVQATRERRQLPHQAEGCRDVRQVAQAERLCL